ncbi:MAG: ABC transporter permease [Terracidiphilus sp.]|jgi:ABC-2 type transport system permease protein
MRNILLIAKREYLEQIRSRAFKFSTVLVPVLIIGLIGWSAMTSSKGGTGKHVTIVADNASLANLVRSEMLRDASADFTVDVVAPVTPGDRSTMQSLTRNKSVDGVLNIDTSSDGGFTASYTSLTAGGFINTGGLQNYLNRGVVHERLIARDMKPAEIDAILKWVPIDSLSSGKRGKAEKNRDMTRFAKAFTMALLLSMPILLYGMNMARAIIEEKTSRIFEVMLAIAKPDDLLTGKLVGVGAVGLTQIAIWVAAAALLSAPALAGPVISGNLSLHFSWVEGVLFPVYFVLGFFLFSSLFSGLAATCETVQDLQMFTPLAAIPVWISFGILPVLLNEPDSRWAVIASLFPLTAPYVMIPRIGMGTVPLWQVGASIGIMLISIWATLWFSTRLYRVGILMYGKRATIPEILRWLRYS